MAKLFWVLFLVLLVAVTINDVEVDAQKRCTVILDNKGCELSTCQEQCYKSYKGRGVCTQGVQFGSYICSCFYDC
ncbi:hypothetical protein CASFOL_030973 [Castilleja foliolosa]|uniref:Uncharacterized protein n=1 Tax=Castilleja foliolosa TaxID=1961234 RepID=A0ABD3C7X4_9LAMI